MITLMWNLIFLKKVQMDLFTKQIDLQTLKANLR